MVATCRKQTMLLCCLIRPRQARESELHLKLAARGRTSNDHAVERQKSTTESLHQARCRFGSHQLPAVPALTLVGCAALRVHIVHRANVDLGWAAVLQCCRHLAAVLNKWCWERRQDQNWLDAASMKVPCSFCVELQCVAHSWAVRPQLVCLAPRHMLLFSSLLTLNDW